MYQNETKSAKMMKVDANLEEKKQYLFRKWRKLYNKHEGKNF